jgi:hypothetical protein
MRRLGKVTAGFGLMLGGIALLFLPGPGLVTIFAGISLVAGEFKWASNVSVWAKKKAARLTRGESPRPSDSEDQTG